MARLRETLHESHTGQAVFCKAKDAVSWRSSQVWRVADVVDSSVFVYYFYFTYANGRLHAERSGGLA